MLQLFFFHKAHTHNKLPRALNYAIYPPNIEFNFFYDARPTNSEAWRGLDRIKARYQSWMNRANRRGQ